MLNAMGSVLADAVGALGGSILRMIRLVGALLLTVGRTLRASPRLWGHEFLRSMAQFGTQSLPVTFGVAVLTGALVVVQTSMYVERFGVRLLVGWAAGYAVLWEFGPLLLGVMMAARVGARNAAELAALSQGGQMEGLRGVSLDPYALLVGPRILAIAVSTLALAPVVFGVAFLMEGLASFVLLSVPLRSFFASADLMLGVRDAAGGLIKSMGFGIAVALVSTTVGLTETGGSRAVGRAAARAMTYSCFAIFLLDVVLTWFFAQVLGL